MSNCKLKASCSDLIIFTYSASSANRRILELMMTLGRSFKKYI